MAAVSAGGAVVLESAGAGESLSVVASVITLGTTKSGDVAITRLKMRKTKRKRGTR
jgi:hypothetical protein